MRSLAACLTLTATLLSAQQPHLRWRASTPLLAPGPRGSFDETAVKDPSIVRYNGRWHLFYTARGRGRYNIGYVSAARLEGLAAAPRHLLAQLRGQKEEYAAAPQIFYFRPQKLWYLIYQTTDGWYQPVYSTSANIDQPQSWTAPRPLLLKTDEAKWIDFWVIADAQHAYLFYTRSHREVMSMSTPLSQFPHGFRDARRALDGVHEAVHIYRVRATGEPYQMIFETFDNQLRKFGLASASSLAGPWKRVTDDFASGSMIEKPSWTGEASHGELLRSGYDERLEVRWRRLQFLIQGMPAGEHKGEYVDLPWRVGILEGR